MSVQCIQADVHVLIAEQIQIWFSATPFNQYSQFECKRVLITYGNIAADKILCLYTYVLSNAHNSVVCYMQCMTDAILASILIAWMCSHTYSLRPYYLQLWLQK